MILLEYKSIYATCREDQEDAEQVSNIALHYEAWRKGMILQIFISENRCLSYCIPIKKFMKAVKKEMRKSGK